MDYKAVLQFIIKDPIRKIFAIVFAFGLWFFVAIDNNYQYARDIKIIYSNLPESLIIVDSIASINVTLIGRGGSLLNTWAAPPKARCSLRNSHVGKNTIPIKKLVVPVGFGDITVNYNTTSINVKIDNKVNEKMRVSVPYKGSLKHGYSISEIVVLDTVNVIGPKEIVRNLYEISTETLNVKNKTSSFVHKLKVVDVPPLLQLSKKEIQVEVKIDTAIDRLFTNIPLKLIFTPEQRVSSEKISLDTLIVKGPRKKLEGLMKRQINVKIKLTKLTPGEYELPATIILPDYIRPVYSYPKKFKLKIY